MHIRLERNHSSPLIGGHSSPALSSRLSSNCPSAEPPTDPAEPEDLEVSSPREIVLIFVVHCFIVVGSTDQRVLRRAAATIADVPER